MKKLFLFFLLTTSFLTAQQRGMKIIVNDNKGIPQELPLYNKTYAVIIGIDRYKNLDYNLQLKNAVSDAKGVQKLLAEKFSFDKFTSANERLFIRVLLRW